LAQFPTRVHPHRCELGPITLPAIHRSSRATYRLSTSTIIWTSEHDYDCTDPAARCSEPKPTAQEVAFPLRGNASRVFTAQGSLRSASSLTTPASTSVAVSADLPQPDSTRTPFVAYWCWLLLGTSCNRRPNGNSVPLARTLSFGLSEVGTVIPTGSENQLAGARRAEARFALKGRLTQLGRETEPRSTAPWVPSTFGPAPSRERW